MTDELRALGHRLVVGGLTEQALLAWAGTYRLSLLPNVVPALAARPVGPAATALALFVAGAELASDVVARRLPLAALLAHGLVERAGDRVRAAVAILPLARCLLVCDRLDAEDHVDLVCWPDDSSYHLASALAPGRVGRWLDLGTGSAFAALARPEHASAITGVELNARAVRYARLGLALSGVGHVTIEHGDLATAPAQPADVVTCNAPIPDDAEGTPRLRVAEIERAVWRRTDRAFFERLWRVARDRLAPGGQVIVHAALDALPDALPGEVAIVVYTPPAERAFAIQWWTPEAPGRRAVGYRELTPARPHVEPRDRAELLAGGLSPPGR
ncbi:MAG TPA: methyltransferase [Kofleriaceae bacterium]|nr:methyltransferase [Kofleriaceae bacterium]